MRPHNIEIVLINQMWLNVEKYGNYNNMIIH